MSGTDKAQRAELVEARDKIRRELEILQAPSTIGGPADTQDVIIALREELTEIEAILAGH